MADTYYAWSNFVIPASGDKAAKKFKPGDTVSMTDLGVPKEEWDAYVESGAVRTTKYPEMGNFLGSPRELRLAQLDAAARGEEYDIAQADLPAGTPPEK